MLVIDAFEFLVDFQLGFFLLFTFDAVFVAHAVHLLGVDGLLQAFQVSVLGLPQFVAEVFEVVVYCVIVVVWQFPVLLLPPRVSDLFAVLGRPLLLSVVYQIGLIFVFGLHDMVCFLLPVVPHRCSQGHILLIGHDAHQLPVHVGAVALHLVSFVRRVWSLVLLVLFLGFGVLGLVVAVFALGAPILSLFPGAAGNFLLNTIAGGGVVGFDPSGTVPLPFISIALMQFAEFLK